MSVFFTDYLGGRKNRVQISFLKLSKLKESYIDLYFTYLNLFFKESLKREWQGKIAK